MSTALTWSRYRAWITMRDEAGPALDHIPAALQPGEVAFVPADAEFQVDGGPSGASAWVTTTPGLEAVTADGARITLPWAA